MSFTGNLAMGLLRLFKPGKGSFSDFEKSRQRADKENGSFRFAVPKSRKADFELAEGCGKPCLVIHPKRLSDPKKAVLYIYGGVTNNWNTQKSMAVQLAVDSGAETWYPVYPAMSEVCITETVRYLTEIYRRMTEKFAPEKIAIVGVSMGGQFALALLSMINQLAPGIPMPGLVIAHSPGGAADCEADWDGFRKYEPRDPLFSEGDLRMCEQLIPHTEPIPDWVLYPAKMDFRSAPDTWLYYGEEMLAGNAPLYRRAFERSGAVDRLHISIQKNMMHAYSCIPVFPESRRSYAEMLRLIERL